MNKSLPKKCAAAALAATETVGRTSVVHQIASLTSYPRSPRWHGNRVAAGPELWLGSAEEEDSPGGVCWKEIYFSGNIRSICRIRCRWFKDYGRKDRGRKSVYPRRLKLVLTGVHIHRVLDRQWYQEVDHQRPLQRLLHCGLPNRGGVHRDPHRAGTRRRDDTDQDVILSSSWYGIHHL